MLNEMPKDKNTPFNANSDEMRRNFAKQRKRIAAKLKNSRITKITFHTFRNWKATMEYHKTKDLLYVMKLLGHNRSHVVGKSEWPDWKVHSQRGCFIHAKLTLNVWAIFVPQA